MLRKRAASGDLESPSLMKLPSRSVTLGAPTDIDFTHGLRKAAGTDQPAFLGKLTGVCLFVS